MKTKSWVYILVNKETNIYKIGKTDNLKTRINYLQKLWGKFDLSQTLAIRCDKDYSFKLESLLQNLMIESRVEFERETRSGRTELFNLDSLNDLKIFINDYLLNFNSSLKLVELENNEIMKVKLEMIRILEIENVTIRNNNIKSYQELLKHKDYQISFNSFDKR